MEEAMKMLIEKYNHVQLWNLYRVRYYMNMKLKQSEVNTLEKLEKWHTHLRVYCEQKMRTEIEPYENNSISDTLTIVEIEELRRRLIDYRKAMTILEKMMKIRKEHNDYLTFIQK
jgi:hypothetical protein